MIPVLYEYDATSFATLGIGSLSECTSCEATEERNGRYELALKYPMDGHLFSELKEERIVRAKANDSQRGVQAFRIYRISKPMNGTVTVYAQHISYDLAAIAVKPFSLTSRTPYQVMQALIAASLTTNPFSCYSDVSNQIDLSSETPLSIRAALGAVENSMLSQVDGEFEWDNLTVRFLASRGSDSGVTVEFGKNMTKLNSEGDTTSAYTHLMPFATYEDASGVSHTVTLTEGVLAIPTTLSGKKTLIHDFSDEFKEETTKDEAALRRIAQAYLAENPLGVAMPTTTVSFEPLWKSAGGPEEKINLCDTLTVRFPKLGVNAKAKVVKVVYDCLLEKPKSVTIGELKANLVDSIQEIEKEAKKTSAAVRDVPTEIQRKIDEATAQITGANGGCVVLRRHADGTPYELLVMDDEDIADAQGVWRWNIGGLGYSSNGYQGPYATAITADGSIVADFITAGTLSANLIHAGTISSLDGTSWWNVETGDIQLSGTVYATAGSIGAFAINADGISTGPASMDDKTHPGLFLANTGINFNSNQTTSQYRSYVTVKPSGAVDGHGMGPHIAGGTRSSQIIDTESSFMMGATLLSMKNYVEPDEYLGNGPTFRVRLSSGEWGGDRNVQLYAYPAVLGEDECVEEGNEDDPILMQMSVGHLWDSNIGYATDVYVQMYSPKALSAQSYGKLGGTWRSQSAITVTSDREAKEGIEDLPDAYSALFDGLRPVRFRYKEGSSGRYHTGFVAQEAAGAAERAGVPLSEFAALCRHEAPDGKGEWGIRYEELIALCVKEIQALKLDVRKLKEEKE